MRKSKDTLTIGAFFFSCKCAIKLPKEGLYFTGGCRGPN